MVVGLKGYARKPGTTGSPFYAEPAGGGTPDGTSQAVFPEKSISLPWVIDPATSWLAYDAWVEVHLDAGIALHKPLPSSDPTSDDLGTTEVGAAEDFTAASGVNVTPTAPFQDVVQRMATPTYLFVLKGFGLRAGYQVPIPFLRSVGLFPAVPGEVQRAYNKIVDNAPGGIPVWFAEWEKWYVVAGLGQGAAAPVPANPALHIRPDAALPLSVQLPWSQSDMRNRPGSSTLRTTRLPGQGSG